MTPDRHDQQLKEIQSSLLEIKYRLDSIQAGTGQVHILNGDTHSSTQQTDVNAAGDITGVMAQSGTGGVVDKLTRFNKRFAIYTLLLVVAWYAPEIKQVAEGFTTLVHDNHAEEDAMDDLWMQQYD
jgi:hypothetical protein